MPRVRPAHPWLAGAGRGFLGVVGCIVCATMADSPPVAPQAPAPTSPRRVPTIPAAIASLVPAAHDDSGFQPLLATDPATRWTQCGPGGFAWTNGVVTSHGGMGLWWLTSRTVTNFSLRGEVRLLSADSDTGVFVRFPPPGDDPWNAVRQGHELEIGDDPEGKDPTWRTGALYPFSPPTAARLRPAGQWNQFELTAIDHTYVVRLNHETVNVWTDPDRRSGSGHVGLQNYAAGQGAQYRNLRLKDLPLSAAAQGADWPGARRLPRQGRSSETGFPLTWDSSHNLAWKTLVPGEAWSSPIVSRPPLWLRTAAHLYCIRP